MAFPLLLALNLAMLIPSLIQSIVTAEQLFTGRGQGTTKKEWVMNALQLIISGMITASTGGQLQTWQMINNPKLLADLGDAVDVLCKILFPKEK